MSSSSAPACPASAPATTSRPSARGPATPSSRRAARSAAPGTSSATRASGPTPTCSRSATRSARGTARSRSPTARRSCSTSRTPPRPRASTSASASTTASPHAAWSTDDGVWHVTAERTDTGETVQLTAGFLFSCSGYYRYDQGYQPDFPGMDRFSGPIVHPQAWPEDLDYAGKKVVVIGSGATAVTLIPSMADTAGARHDAPAVAHLHHVAARQGPDRQRPAADPPRADLRARRSAGTRRSPRRRSSSSASVARSFAKKMLRKGVERQLPEGLRRRHPLHARATTRGTSGCASCPTATCSRRSRRGGRRSSPTTSRPSPRPASSCSRASTSTPTSSSPPPASSCLFIGGIQLSIDGEPLEIAEQAHLQGDDARGRAEPRHRHRLHERLVDAEVRPHLPVRHPAASTTCTPPGCASARR